MRGLKNHGFTQPELDCFSKSLLKLTENILTEKVSPLPQLQNQIESLGKRREALLAQKIHDENIPQTVYTLLNDCIQFGTLPFSVLARYAFIGTAFLNSLVSVEIISEGDYTRFMNSIHTVTTDFLNDLSQVQAGKLTREKFLSKYGHLRPGTYDILSPRYDELPELYLNFKTGESLQVDASSAFNFSPSQLNRIGSKLEECNLTCSAERLISFIRSSIEAREWAKFEFTKNLSAGLSLLARFAGQHGLSKEDCSFIPIHYFLKLTTENPSSNFVKEFHDLITKYGGAASHMAIRAAEFGLPAAIGCGDSIFRSLVTARKVELNCSAKLIRII